jgi:aminoglycoside phosphotransferase family enzyme
VQLFRRRSLADKVEFLSRPEAYPDAPESVTAIETHFAWVFLSRDYAYKLKKPVRLPNTDLRTAHARKANCELELALNRRLAGETYIGVVALGRRGSELRLECDTRPVDWLVKMHRLPDDATLENQLPRIDVGDVRLQGLMQTLCGFYARAVPAPWTAADYAARLKQQARRNAKGFRQAELRPQRAAIRRIAEAHCGFVDSHTELLSQRIRQGRIRDAHGDLRPEHVFLNEHPQIIDCLEFSSDLRQLDTAEEVVFLTLECERLGRADVALRLLELYRETCADAVPDALVDFYRSRRAFVRAYVSAWHLGDDLDQAAKGKWIAQTTWYLEAAATSLTRARAEPGAD